MNLIPSMFVQYRSSSFVRRLLLLYPRAEDLLRYVETQWLQDTPLPMWNVYEREKFERTTNVCESWNSLWKRQLGRTNPTLWVAISSLKVQEKLQRRVFRRIQRGERPPRPGESEVS